MEGKNTLKEKGFRTRQCERHRDNLQRIQEEEKQVAEGTWKNVMWKLFPGNSLAVQLVGFGAFTAEGWGSILGRGTKIPQASRRG